MRSILIKALFSTFFLFSIFSSLTFAEEYTDNVIKPMKSNTDPAPQVASASSSFEGSTWSYLPFKAFNGIKKGGQDDAWGVNKTDGWISIDFGAINPKKIAKYAITSYDYTIANEYSPKSWTFEGSQDGIKWTVLDSRSEQLNWKAAETRQYNITNDTWYRYYRLNVSSTNGTTRLGIAEIEMMESTSPISVPSNLTANGGDSSINLSWNAVAGATGYNVKRSTTPGGPYTQIASNVTAVTYADEMVKNGTTYYYVITAITPGGESGNSNEAAATPQAIKSNRALLVITLVSGLEKEYDLPMTDVNAFISWYTGRAAGSGAEIYTINKTYNTANFMSRKDYIAFGKIETFEVNEYTPNQP